MNTTKWTSSLLHPYIPIVVDGYIQLEPILRYSLPNCMRLYFTKRWVGLGRFGLLIIWFICAFNRFSSICGQSAQNALLVVSHGFEIIRVDVIRCMYVVCAAWMANVWSCRLRGPATNGTHKNRLEFGAIPIDSFLVLIHNYGSDVLAPKPGSIQNGRRKLICDTNASVLCVNFAGKSFNY